MHRACFVALLCAACAGAPGAPHEASRSVRSEESRLATVVFPDDPTLGLLRARLAADGDAFALTLRLYDEMGIVVGVDPENVTDDGSYRGVVHTVPALPVGVDRVHLRLVLDALRRVRHVLDQLGERAQRSIAFVRAPKALRFFRTIGGTTPSAYATEGVIGYNLNGELWTSAESVEDTLVHELFHLGDEADHWSEAALVDTFDRIRRECGEDMGCFEPYAPFDTRVDGDVIYAFHPKSDVREYGGELAIRFMREQRDWMIASHDPSRSFKCQRPENAAVWAAFSDRFFASVDLVPPCR